MLTNISIEVYNISNNLITLLICMSIDYITALLLSCIFKKSKKSKGGKFDSQVATQGLAKKLLILFTVLIAYRLDIYVNSHIVSNTTILFYIVNEIISIVENMGLMGLKIPNIISKLLDKLSSDNDVDRD